MAESAWKARVLVRVEDAGGRMENVRAKLDAVYEHLLEPIGMTVDDAAAAAAARGRIEYALGLLKVVSHNMILFEALAHAAEIFALHAGSDDPTKPLAYFQLLGADEHALKHALARLASARSRVVSAYKAVDCCRGHLSSALLLLDHPRLPDVDALVDGERRLANSSLGDARRLTSYCVALVNLALDDMAGANPVVAACPRCPAVTTSMA